MKLKYITAAQLIKLQTLWQQFARTSLMVLSNDRSVRLEWASKVVGREIKSFNALTNTEASDLINILNTSMGLAESSPAQAEAARRRLGSRIKDKERAHRAGTAGRRGSRSKVVAPASAEDFERIDAMLNDLGWSRAQLDGWLRSLTSPLGRGRSEIRTDADANKVYWALKRMATAKAKGRQV